MNSVPYSFCSSVFATLPRPPSSNDRFSSKNWQRAADENAQNRVSCSSLRIAYEDGVWSYHLKKGSNSLTVQELMKLNRRHFRIESVFVMASTYNQSTFAEIKALIKHTLPCLNMASFRLLSTTKFPQKHLWELLSMYENTVFRSIVTTDNSEQILDFLIPHVNSDLDVHERSCSASLATAIEKEALCKKPEQLRFHDLVFCVVGAPIGMEFFAQLFEKPICGLEQFSFVSAFDFVDFRNFQKNCQISQSETRVVWCRVDGTTVEVTKQADKVFSSYFQNFLFAKV